MMTTLRMATIVACLGAAALAGCGGSAPGDAAGPVGTEGAAALPGTLFVASAPAEAMSLVDAKAAASAGDRVVFEARVGGRRDPFVAGRAMFLVADASLPSCDQLEGDACRTPWDYCCETPESLLKHLATVQVVDGDGRPLRASLQDQHGLGPLRTIVVAGTVEQADASGNFIVNAESIYVKEEG